MRLVVSGSIATDHLMVFPGRFSEQLLPDKLDSLSLSFLVDELSVRRGGAAANIAFNLGCLGLRPLLVGAVGADFAEYGDWLSRNGVDLDGVAVSASRHTARFICTTDQDQNQIASFYAGAMAEAAEIDLGQVLRPLDGPALVVVAPNDPEAMLRHTAHCRAAGVRFAADPSQQLARMDGEQIRALVDGAEYLFTNEYERGLLEHKTGWDTATVRSKVRVWVTTLGAQGVCILRGSEEAVLVPAVPAERVADPTGVGDAFRAGYLAGKNHGLDDEPSARLGCTLATTVLESVGTQEHPTDRRLLLDRLAGAYGQAAADEIAAGLDALART